jgi:hypothetical protein
MPSQSSSVPILAQVSVPGKTVWAQTAGAHAVDELSAERTHFCVLTAQMPFRPATVQACVFPTWHRHVLEALSGVPSQSLSKLEEQSRVPLGTSCTQGPHVPWAVHFCVPGAQIPYKPVEHPFAAVLAGSHVAQEPLLQVPPVEHAWPMATHVPVTQHPPPLQAFPAQQI